MHGRRSTHLAHEPGILYPTVTADLLIRLLITLLRAGRVYCQGLLAKPVHSDLVHQLSQH